MSLTAIINLAERLLNNSSGQSVDTGSNLRQSKQAAQVDSEAKAGDQFTPSPPTQQDAGLFQARQISIFSAAADFLFSQTAPQANSENGPATPAPTPQPAPQIVATVPAAQAPAVSATPAAIVPTAAPAAGNASSANATNSLNSTQNQLLALNSALSALGLNDSQLAQIDRIASLIQVFNPLAFTSLVYQLEALAQANTSQLADGAIASGAATPNAGRPGTAGGFQIQELTIKFSGIQGSFNQTGAGTQGGNSSVQISAFNLQVEEVNLTLANPAGKSLLVTAPQPAAVISQASAPPSGLAKSAAA